jgi:hypothetical protein
MTEAVNPLEHSMRGALEPPPGVIPKLVLHDSRIGGVMEKVIICLLVTGALLLARLYAKLCLIKSHGWEDCRCFSRLIPLGLTDLPTH